MLKLRSLITTCFSSMTSTTTTYFRHVAISLLVLVSPHHIDLSECRALSWPHRGMQQHLAAFEAAQLNEPSPTPRRPLQPAWKIGCWKVVSVQRSRSRTNSVHARSTPGYCAKSMPDKDSTRSAPWLSFPPFVRLSRTRSVVRRRLYGGVRRCAALEL
jgi:hypothetical protein